MLLICSIVQYMTKTSLDVSAVLSHRILDAKMYSSQSTVYS